VKSADFVQENGPERIDFKEKLYRQLDELLPADVIIASEFLRPHHEPDSIGLPLASRTLCHWPSVQSAALGPLVEIVGGVKTRGSDQLSGRGILHGFGETSRPVAQGKCRHVANRLQAALAREVYYLGCRRRGQRGGR